MNENDFAMDAFNRIRDTTKETTDALGRKMADQIVDGWVNDPTFKKDILPGIAQAPAFFYADIFDAMAKRLTERCQAEAMWYELDKKDDSSEK